VAASRASPTRRRYVTTRRRRFCAPSAPDSPSDPRLAADSSFPRKPPCTHLIRDPVHQCTNKQIITRWQQNILPRVPWPRRYLLAAAATPLPPPPARAFAVSSLLPHPRAAALSRLSADRSEIQNNDLRPKSEPSFEGQSLLVVGGFVNRVGL
jgi:hypothetical protein